MAVLDILEDCPRLESLRSPLQAEYQMTARRARRPVIRHEPLQELRLSSTLRAVVPAAKQSIRGLFDSLIAPRLCIFEAVVHGESDNEDTLDAAAEFLAASECTITELRITMNVSDAHHWIALFPDLESLELVAHHSDPRVTFPFLDAYELAQVPRIKHIGFFMESRSRNAHVKIKWDVLLRILQSRENVDAGLSSLDSIKITSICHKDESWVAGTCFPPDELFEVDGQALDREQVKEMMRLLERVHVVQKWCIDHDTFLEYSDSEDREGLDQLWPEHEYDDDGNTWLVRRWPNSQPIDGDADPLAYFDLHLPKDQHFKKKNQIHLKRSCRKTRGTHRTATLSAARTGATTGSTSIGTILECSKASEVLVSALQYMFLKTRCPDFASRALDFPRGFWNREGMRWHTRWRWREKVRRGKKGMPQTRTSTSVSVEERRASVLIQEPPPDSPELSAIHFRDAGRDCGAWMFLSSSACCTGVFLGHGEILQHMVDTPDLRPVSAILELGHAASRRRGRSRPRMLPA
ncbi:F-box domain-containing protein [Mycena chlorophos]|uniref:F-box domain-containing protein n=1 Tax=Mycena chlorophos TaxID=658473 RepID=A0A8H6S3H9_MYCCL|nr:F-box domain-containing protein [Mycena chlorophos]